MPPVAPAGGVGSTRRCRCGVKRHTLLIGLYTLRRFNQYIPILDSDICKSEAKQGLDRLSVRSRRRCDDDYLGAVVGSRWAKREISRWRQPRCAGRFRRGARRQKEIVVTF